jgi:ribosomal protein S18 acetylase RimI-like enzyme
LACLRAAFEPYREQYTADAFLDTVLSLETLAVRMRAMAVFVAVGPNGVIGTIAAQAVDDVEGHLRGMAVRPDSQGRAVAHQLLTAALAELRVLGCSRVTLDTTEPLRRAVRFYEKNGFRPTGRVSEFFGMSLFEYARELD